MTFVYMSPIAGQTAGPIGLKFFVDTHEKPGQCLRLKKIEFLKKKIPRATPGPPVSYH